MVIYTNGANTLLGLLAGGASPVRITGNVTTDPTDELSITSPLESSPSSNTVVFNRTLQVSATISGVTANSPGTSYSDMAITFGADNVSVGHVFTPVTLTTSVALRPVFAIPLRLEQ